MTTVPPSSTPPKPTKWIGFRESYRIKSEERRNREGPQPWIVRKLLIGIVFGLVGYSYYVFVERLCVPMIRKDGGAFGTFGTGVALLVVYNIIFLFWLWAYIKVIITPPGYARNHVRKTPPPPTADPNYGEPRHWELDTDFGTASFESMRARDEYRTGTPPPDPSSRPDSAIGPDVEKSAALPIPQHQTNLNPLTPPLSSTSVSSGAPPETTHEMDALPRSLLHPNPTPPPTPPIPTIPPSTAASNLPNRSANANMNMLNANRSSDLPPPIYSRRPLSHPILADEYRYCRKDGILKPMRTHHCRACGTCVLKYDHHCPWIGQCVGARNHKFFFNFCHWNSVYTLFLFISLIILSARNSSNIDAQHVVVIALAGLFGLFTITLSVTHLWLIIINASTVEHLGMRRMKERERSILDHLYPFHKTKERKALKKSWNREWGTIETEGNIWWLGSGMKNWTAIMGDNPWKWFLPMGRSKGDGLTYEINPRFTQDGRWRRRSEWPDELR